MRTSMQANPLLLDPLGPMVFEGAALVPPFFVRESHAPV